MLKLGLVSVAALIATIAMYKVLPARKIAAPKPGTAAPLIRTPSLAPGTLWRESNLDCDAEQCHVRISINPKDIERPAGGGDLATIAFDLRHASRSQKLLLSVEPITLLTVERFPPATREISLDELLKGGSYDFTIPHVGKTMPFGIFLCKDRERRGRCQAKKIVNMARVMPLDAIAVQRHPGFQSPDLTFFFQLVVVENGKVSVLPDMEKPDLSNDAFSARLTELKKKVVSTERKLVDSEMEVAKNNSRILRSFPLRFSGTQIDLFL